MIQSGASIEFQWKQDNTLSFRGRLCVPQDEDLKKEILDEAHSFAYAMHPGSTKMYRTLREYYW